MSLIKKGISISKAFRNMGRLKEIVTVFAKNGFDEFLAAPLAGTIPDFVLPKSKIKLREEMKSLGARSFQETVGMRLRLAFEELGPAFIKFGQLLSSREDIFASEFIDQMKLLRDKVRPIEFNKAKAAIEKSFNKPIDDVFESFDQSPIGTASIGTVYQGTLKDGREVVVKVRRPNIKNVIETDFSIVLFLVAQLEKASSDIRYLGLSRVLKDFSISLQTELNFHVETQNAKRFKDNLYKRDNGEIFYIPEIYEEYTSEDVLVMEKLKGVPFSDANEINKHINELDKKLTTGLKFFMKSFLSDGFFHADLHGGNFFYLENGKIGIIDYGLMGTLSKKSRQNFIAIIYAMLTFNYENLIYEFLDVSEYENIPDIDHLIGDVRDALSPYIGLTVQQTNYSEVFKAIVATLNKHRLFLPRDWFIVFRALITLDGVGKSLGLDFDIFGLLEGDIESIIKDSVNKEDIMEEMVWTARDIAPFVRVLPRHMKWFIKDWSKKGYRFEVKNTGYEKSFLMLSGSLNFLGFALFAGVCVISGNGYIDHSKVLTLSTIPTLSIIFWAIGLMSFLRGIFFINR